VVVLSAAPPVTPTRKADIMVMNVRGNATDPMAIDPAPPEDEVPA